MIRTVPYRKTLLKFLARREEAAAYLNAALEDDDMQYLLKALRNVVAANGGMSRLAKAAKMSRTSLYKTLSPSGNPEVTTLEAILAVYGIRLGFFAVEPPPGHNKHATGRGHYLSP